MAIKYWYPRTCSEDHGCILELTNATTLAGISKTCTGHSEEFGRAIGIPAFLGLAHNDPISGDQDVHTAIAAQNVAGTEEAPGNAFKIKDEMRIGDVSALGMDDLLVIYESSLHPTSDHEAPPDPSFLATSFASFVAANPGVTRVCLDQETWWNSSGQLPPDRVSYYLDLIDIAHDYWPDVGLYSGVPERYSNYLNFPPGHATHISRKNSWIARCEANSLVFDAVNTLYPSLYYINPVYANAANRNLWFQDNLDICASIAPSKPVLPFLWPRIHNSVDPAMPYIGGTYWRDSIDYLYNNGAEGFVIWLFSSDVDPRTQSPVPDWWTQTLDFISDNSITA